MWAEQGTTPCLSVCPASAGVPMTHSSVVKAAAVVLGIFVGSYYGSFLLFKIKTKVLRPVFVVIILFMALKMFLKGTNLKLF